MTWISHAWPQIFELLGAHLRLSWIPVVLSVLIAVPIGYLAHRSPRIGGAVLGAASLLYAIPALPLLIIIPALLSFPLRSSATLITALTVYGVALLVRTTADAFGSVDTATTLSATAVGHSAWQQWWRVELPLATPVIVAGARVVTVSTVGLVTIGALIGVPSLGTLFTDGFQRGIPAAIITGIVGTVLVALLLDGVCALIGRLLTPWRRAERRTRRSSPAATLVVTGS